MYWPAQTKFYDVNAAMQWANTNYTILLKSKVCHKQDDSEFVVIPHGYGNGNERTVIEFFLLQQR